LEEYYDIPSSFGFTDKDKKNFDTVVDKFECYFVKKRNIIFEHANASKRMVSQLMIL